MFIERASSNTIATSIAAGDFRSAVGLRATTDRWFAAAYFTGPVSGAIHAAPSTPSTAISATEQYGAIARATYQLLQGDNYSLHIGGNAEILLRPPLNRATGAQTLTISDRPELRIDPTAVLTTGAIQSVSRAQVYGAEAAAGYGPFFIQGEYFWYKVDRQFGLPSLNFEGGYVEASWTLTGESRKYIQSSGAYSRIFPDHPFSITSGGWGAWEIAGRYSTIDLNDRLGFSNGVAGGQQTVLAGALNWYPNANVRFMFNYLHGTIDKQSTALNATNTGAKFDAVALRSQVQF
jgi:phosphate-selective porin OprO/OprP